MSLTELLERVDWAQMGVKHIDIRHLRYGTCPLLVACGVDKSEMNWSADEIVEAMFGIPTSETYPTLFNAADQADYLTPGIARWRQYMLDKIAEVTR